MKDTSAVSLPIHSVNSLMLELPPIKDTIDFCICLGVPLRKCRRILSDHQGSAEDMVKQIAAVWYSQSNNPTWAAVVEALFCHYHSRDAVQIAERKGVEWRTLFDKYKHNNM